MAKYFSASLYKNLKRYTRSWGEKATSACLFIQSVYALLRGSQELNRILMRLVFLLGFPVLNASDPNHM